MTPMQVKGRIHVMWDYQKRVRLKSRDEPCLAATSTGRRCGLSSRQLGLTEVVAQEWIK